MIIEVIANRRSIRKYNNQDIDDSVILELIESARLAPSGNNVQPWQFIIVKNPDKKIEIEKLAHNQLWMTTAPVFIVCIVDISTRMEDIDAEINENSPHEDLKRVIRDSAIAIEHIVLQAVHQGFGTCWISWFRQHQMRPVLNLPNDKYIITILTIGYPDEMPAVRPRKDIQDIIRYELW